MSHASKTIADIRRDAARRTNGQFGQQEHADCGIVDPGPATTMLPDGTVRFTVNGVAHRDGGPAVIWADGTEEWRQNGELHRDGGPAIVSADGLEQMFYSHGLLHNLIGPAVLRANGRVEHWVNGRLSCDDGPAVITEDGEEEYWFDGVRAGGAFGNFDQPLLSA